MGGCGSRNPTSCEEESAIEFHERDLKFHLLSPREIDLYIRKYARNGSLTQKQFERVARVLDINISQGDQVKQLWTALTNGYAKQDWDMEQITDMSIMENYRMLNLILLGVMLSTGDCTDKAEIFFEAYDPQITGYLTRDTFQEMINDLFYTICEVLPELAEENAKKEGADHVVTRQAMRLFRQTLERGKEEGEKKFIEYMFPGGDDHVQVTKAEFIRRLTLHLEFVTSAGFRLHFRNAGAIKFEKFQHGPDFTTDINKIIETSK